MTKSERADVKLQWFNADDDPDMPRTARTFLIRTFTALLLLLLRGPTQKLCKSIDIIKALFLSSIVKSRLSRLSRLLRLKMEESGFDIHRGSRYGVGYRVKTDRHNNDSSSEAKKDQSERATQMIVQKTTLSHPSVLCIRVDVK